MTEEADYEDIEFAPPPKSTHPYRYTPTVPIVQPVAPPRSSSRSVDRESRIYTEKPVPPVPASKPKRPPPPPKPRTYESSDEPSSNTSPSHELKRQSLSMDAPSLPPKPDQVTSPSKSKSLSFDASHSPLMRRTNILTEIGQLPGDQMNLSEFVRNHSKELPLRVRVDEGFCGNDERFIISTGDVYNLHFLKTVKVASIQDVGGGHFTVPLNSSIKFGLLYNPDNDFHKSVQGYQFENVAAITAAKVQPKLIRSTVECLCTDPKSSVEADELLLIKKVGKTALKRRPYIKVFNVKTKEEKTLYDDCIGNFITTPSAVQMYLPELLQHLGDCLPLQTMLYVTSDSEDSTDIPLDLTTEMVTLTHTSIETSIVATTYWGEDESGLGEEDFTPIAIPIELEIEITVLKDESEDDDLYTDTKALLQTFNPLKIKDMAEAKTDKGAQSRLYKNVRKGYELSGLKIEPPSRIYDIVGPSPILPKGDASHFFSNPSPLQHQTLPTPHLQPKHTSPTPSPVHKGHTSPSTSHLHTRNTQSNPYRRSPSREQGLPPVPNQPLKSVVSQHNAPGTLQRPTGSVENQISDLHSNTRALKCLLDAMQDNSGKITSDIKSELKRLGRIVENLSRNYDRLEKQVEDLTQSNSTRKSFDSGYVPSPKTVAGHEEAPQNPFSIRRASSRIKKTADPDQKARNIEELASMDCGELLTLLAALNMSKYQKDFEAEQVDGEVLIECDEEVLRAELNIDSLIHRKKLMSIINGSQSPVSVIQSCEREHSAREGLSNAV